MLQLGSALLAAIGATFLVGSVLFAALGPVAFEPFLRIPGPIWYDPFLVVLAISTGAGSAVGGAIAFVRGGVRAALGYLLFVAGIVALGIVPVMQDRARWIVAVPLLDPSDPFVLTQ